MVRKKAKILLTNSALNDLNNLLEFYKKLMFKLAKNLVLELDETFKFLQNNPSAFDSTWNGKFGIITLRKYPIEIYYTIQEHNIIVLALEHKNNTPLKWIKRV